MPGLEPAPFTLRGQGQLSDYVTAIAASSDRHCCGLATATGEVIRLDLTSLQVETLQSPTHHAIGCLALSEDGQILAAGNQAGQVQCWRWDETPVPIAQLSYANVWIDRMAWHPTESWLAIAVGRSVIVWDVTTQTEVAQLDFQASSVLALAWQPQGHFLAVSGYQGTKIWPTHDWQAAPIAWENLSTSLALAWSPDGRYLAIGNMDNTLTLYEWGQDYPWLMRGFPGKIRHLVWQPAISATTAPLLAMASGCEVILWQQASAAIGWSSQRLQGHGDIVQAIAFQPKGQQLASAGADGWIGIWQADTWQQTLSGASQGFSTVAWVGDRLVAGSCDGQWLVWGTG